MPPPAPTLLRSPLLSELPWLLHAFSTRQSGRPGRDFDLHRSVLNQRRFLRAILAPAGRQGSGGPAELLQMRQIHSDLVWTDPAANSAGDAMITGRPGRLLAIRTADCCPILLADTRLRVVAAIHAGWRGTLARIAEKTVGELRAAFGSNPADLVAAIGPGIRGCCYEVGAEVQQAFAARFDYASALFQSAEDDPVRSRYPMLFMTGAPPGHPYDPRWSHATPLRLDLAAANARQLQAAGLAAASVDVLPFCTACRTDLFFSHRAGASGRMLSAIGLISKALALPAGPSGPRPRALAEKLRTS